MIGAAIAAIAATGWIGSGSVLHGASLLVLALAALLVTMLVAVTR